MAQAVLVADVDRDPALMTCSDLSALIPEMSVGAITSSACTVPAFSACAAAVVSL
jgi:hypothetical protein